MDDIRSKHEVYWSGSLFKSPALKKEPDKELDRFIERIKGTYDNSFGSLLDSLEKDLGCSIKKDDEIEIKTVSRKGGVERDEKGIPIKYLEFPSLILDNDINSLINIRLNPSLGEGLSKIWIYSYSLRKLEHTFPETVKSIKQEKEIIEKTHKLIDKEFLKTAKKIKKLDYNISLYGVGSDWRQIERLYQEYLEDKDRDFEGRYENVLQYLVNLSNQTGLPPNVGKLEEKDYAWSVFDSENGIPNLVAKYSDILSGFTSFYYLAKTNNGDATSLKDGMRDVVLSFNNKLGYPPPRL